MDAYKQRVANFYNSRTDYDNEVTRERALRLINYAPPQPGQQILDVATGTGTVAIAASQIVGADGHVIGIDIATNLLNLAKQKSVELQNIEWIETDAETIEFAPDQFDGIYCSYAIVLLADIPLALQKWFRYLKSHGVLAFTSFSETSFLTPAISQACDRCGISLPNLHIPLGTPERIRQLLGEIGFHAVEIHTEQRGTYRSLEDAKSRWNGQFWLHPDDPFVALESDRIQQLKHEFDAIVETLVTDQGVWDEATTFFVVAYKL
ncbi:class I SAM-dependent methyltransferase [Phormidesmis sp. 146-35]